MLIIDQASKAFVLYALDLPRVDTIQLLPFLNFTMVWNYGISMGLPLGPLLGKIGIIALTTGISLYLIRWMLTSQNRFERFGLAMIIGGAIGNLVDRFIHGAVADFIHLYGFGYHFYVFNGADAAITIGAIVLIGDALRTMLNGPKKATTSGHD